MFEKCEEDKGLINIPMVTPHLELLSFNNEALGVQENTPESVVSQINFSFYIDSLGVGSGLTGTLSRDILHLVDGKRNRHEIVEKLEGQYDSLQVSTMLTHLAYRFILVSAEFDIPLELAAMFSSCGISPLRIQRFIEGFKVGIKSFSAFKKSRHILRQCLKEFGFQVVKESENPDLMILLVDDYLQEELGKYNLRYLKNKTLWLPLKLSGTEGMTGPLFNLEEDEFCAQCLRFNLRNNRELRGFLGHNIPGAHIAKEQVFNESIARGRAAEAIYQFVATVIMKSKLTDLGASDHRHTLKHYMGSHSSLQFSSDWHYINRRPQCRHCGDRALYTQDRKPEPVDVFQGADKPVFTSGGMKACSPIETWTKYKHLISPLSGVITQIIRSSPEDDPWMHVYWAGSNLAIKNRSYRSLTNSLRTKSAGKGRSDIQAKVSAMCEAMERYSGVYSGDEIYKKAKFSDFPEGDAIRPNDIMLFSDKQYASRHEIASKNHRFYRLPEMDFDEDVIAEWTPFWSITREKHVWLLSVQTYFSYVSDDMEVNKFMGNPDSNGAASGNTFSEAFVQGFMELIERDAYAIWWYNQLRYPEVDLGSFNDSFLDEAITRYRKVYHRKLWVLDITNDFGIPVFVAISERVDKTKRDICISAGAHFDPHIAALRAVCELNQYVSAVLFADDDPASYSYYDEECLHWWQNATLESDPYLIPDTSAPKTTPDTYPLVNRSQVEEVQACIDIVHSKGMEVIVKNQTQPDVKVPVAKVLVPGMRHFWARFQKGRLYDVPVAMGKLDKPTKEEDMNPTPVFI